VHQWLVKAKRDVLMAERAAHGSPAIPDGAVFHCQQAAEKALKAFLTWNDRTFRKTHQLQELVLRCADIDGEFQTLRGAAETLTPYAVDFLYPGTMPEPTQEEAEEALDLARQVLSFVLDRLPPEVRTL